MIARAKLEQWEIEGDEYVVDERPIVPSRPKRGGAKGNRGDRLPAELGEIEAAIEDSRYMLTPSDDEEADPPASEATWERAVTFLRHLALIVWQRSNAVLDVPEITLGPNSSVDILWLGKTRKLLINVPADPLLKPSYYGDTCHGTTTKGYLNVAADGEFLLSLLGA